MDGLDGYRSDLRSDLSHLQGSSGVEPVQPETWDRGPAWADGERGRFSGVAEKQPFSDSCKLHLCKKRRPSLHYGEFLALSYCCHLAMSLRNWLTESIFQDEDITYTVWFIEYNLYNLIYWVEARIVFFTTFVSPAFANWSFSIFQF